MFALRDSCAVRYLALAMPKKRRERWLKEQLAGLTSAERKLVSRALEAHPEPLRVKEAEAPLAEGLWPRGLLRPAMIGERYTWHLGAKLSDRRTALFKALAPE
jgi:hypothetical protein